MRYRELRIAIVDPLALVGKDLRELLKARGFPASKTRLFHSSPGAAGQIADDDGEAAFIPPLAEGDLEDAQIVFLCGPAARSKAVLKAHTEGHGTLLCLSPVPQAALVWLNGPKAESRIQRLPHPVAHVLAETLRVLLTLPGTTVPSGISVVVDRPVSEIGKDGLDELFQQAIALATFKPLPKKLLEFQAAFNEFYPEDSEAYERQVAQDFQSIHPALPAPSVFSARAGVFHGHHIRVEVRWDKTPPPLESALKAFGAQESGFDVRAYDDGAGVIDAAGQDDILVLRAGASPDGLHLALACDHLRQPLALHAVRLAEQMVAGGGFLADA